MPRLSLKDKILTHGRQIVHERGYLGASVRDIVQAAGVPQGSFTNHFASKEAFGLEVLDLYFADSRQIMDATLHNEALAPLARLRAYIDQVAALVGRSGVENGCMIGNFSVEANEHSEPIRQRVVEIYAEMQSAVAACLRAAVKAGNLPKAKGTRADELAGFVVASLQGSILMAKAERSPIPLERFKKFLFSTVLR